MAARFKLRDLIRAQQQSAMSQTRAPAADAGRYNGKNAQPRKTAPQENVHREKNGLGPTAYAHSAWFYHGKRILEPQAQLRHSLDHGRWLSATRAATKPDQNHAG